MRILWLTLLSIVTAGGAMAADPSWDSGSSDPNSGFDKELKKAGLTVAPAQAGKPVAVPDAGSRRCPAEMASVNGFCIDRWEDTTVDMGSGQSLSPYYTPNPAKSWPGAPWQFGAWSRKPSPHGYPMPDLPDIHKTGAFEPKAVSAPGVYPQGFMNREIADRSCRNAGKRLCTRDEWYRACVGPSGPQPSNGQYPVAFPYGRTYEKGKCNFQVVPGHPLMIVGRSSSELDDPRLMLAQSGGQRLLAKSGDFSQCTNAYGVYDMVGNQDEVVADTNGSHMVFVGGFYSRDQGANPNGCASAIGAHDATKYTDYSIGFRCCLSPDAQ
jgi:hypothetical protein